MYKIMSPTGRTDTYVLMPGRHPHRHVAVLITKGIPHIESNFLPLTLLMTDYTNFYFPLHVSAECLFPEYNSCNMFSTSEEHLTLDGDLDTKHTVP
jgi:hypothetical protein